MIIEKITAEDVKFFMNETSLNSINEAGGLVTYLKAFMVHAKNSKEILPQLNSVRLNGELISLNMDFASKEEVMVEQVNNLHITNIKSRFKDSLDYSEAKIVFVYNAYSDYDHNYFLTANGKAMKGLECENIELFINENTIPYLPLTAKSIIECDKLPFGLFNEDTESRT